MPLNLCIDSRKHSIVQTAAVIVANCKSCLCGLRTPLDTEALPPTVSIVSGVSVSNVLSAALKVLDLEDCPALHTPPPHVVGAGLSAVQQFLRDLRKGFVPCHLVKVVLLGEQRG
jgi:hypothetical protein